MAGRQHAVQIHLPDPYHPELQRDSEPAELNLMLLGHSFESVLLDQKDQHRVNGNFELQRERNSVPGEPLRQVAVIPGLRLEMRQPFLSARLHTIDVVHRKRREPQLPLDHMDLSIRLHRQSAEQVKQPARVVFGETFEDSIVRLGHLSRLPGRLHPHVQNRLGGRGQIEHAQAGGDAPDQVQKTLGQGILRTAQHHRSAGVAADAHIRVQRQLA